MAWTCILAWLSHMHLLSLLKLSARHDSFQTHGKQLLLLLDSWV